MSYRNLYSRLLGVGLLAFAGLVAHPAHAQSYTVTDLGVLPGSNFSIGFGVNNNGQVTGLSSPANSGYAGHAFLSGPNGGALQDLGVLTGGTSSIGFGVNDSGQVTGNNVTQVNSQGIYHAFLSAPNGGALKYLGTLGGGYSEAGGVNNSGQVTGYSNLTNNGNARAFLSGPNGGTLKDLGTLPDGDYSRGQGVNASGQVTGLSYTGYDNFHAFLSGPNGGALKDLGVLPGDDSSEGRGVNSSGQVTGSSGTANDTGTDVDDTSTYSHAFLSAPNGGALQDLGTLPNGTYSDADSVNDSGQVVGSSDEGYGASIAFLYSGGVMTDLNTLIAPGSGVFLIEATHISNNGFISAYGNASDGTSHAFLLTPITVNTGPKITVTATASTANAQGRRTISVTVTNSGGIAADMLQITNAALGSVPPEAGSPSLFPTTKNNLGAGQSQTSHFYYSPFFGTKSLPLSFGGSYINPNTGVTTTFSGTIRALNLP